MSNLRRLILILTFPAMVQAGELTIVSSEPGAMLSEPGNSELTARRLPFTLKHDEGSDGRVFVIEKPGFAPVYVPVVGELKKHATFTVKLRRLTNWAPEEIIRGTEAAAEKLVDQVYFAQKLLDERKHTEALAVLEPLRAAHPSSVSVRVLHANALLLSGDIGGANALYAAVLEDLPESRKMLRESILKIKRRLDGGRSTASSRPASSRKEGR